MQDDVHGKADEIEDKVEEDGKELEGNAGEAAGDVKRLSLIHI